MALTDKLTAIANAIRSKTGKSQQLSLDDMVKAIMSIQTGEGGGGGMPEGLAFGKLTIDANITVSTTLLTTDDIGFEPSAFYIWRTNALRQNYYISRAMYELRPAAGVGVSNCMKNTVRFYSSAHTPIVSNSTYIYTASAGLLSIPSGTNTIRITASPQYIVPAGEWCWLAVDSSLAKPYN